MEKSGAWGDHLTLVAMSRMFNCAITVVEDSNDPPTIISPPNAETVDAEFTLAHYGEIHYESTMPLGTAVLFT